ncbi:MAG: flippase-like domain-containing protein [Bacteroidales bacterium]|nr:flippase-like domain-containing protein [Bacteroidales bacterium]
MRKKLVNILKYLLSFGLAGLLVWLAFRGIDWHEFFVGLKATRWSWIILYLVVGYLALVFRALRWTQLIHPLDNDIHYGKVWDANNIGGMASIALPGSGDLVRTGLLTTAKLPYQTVFGTVMMERAWDILAILLMFVCSLVFAWGRFGGFFVDNIWHPLQSHAIILWGLAIIVLLIVVALVLIRKLKDRSKFFGMLNGILEGFLTGFKTFKYVKNKFLFLVYSVLIWIMYMLMSFFVLKAIPQLSGALLSDGLFVASLGNIASLVPVPGGIGAYHYLLKVSLMGLYGTTEEISLLFATLCHELHAVLVIVLGVWSYIFRIVILKNGNTPKVGSASRKN